MSNNIQNPDSEAKLSGESDTTFGRSTESQAQFNDARSLASATVGIGDPLNVYRLVPTAPQSDPRWRNSPFQGEVVVAARTAGDARVVASGCELDFMEVDAAPAEGVSTADASAFRDEKLYSVVEIERGRRDLLRGKLEGTVSVATIKPVQI
ncbi:hypothetical protein LPJGGPFB_05134 [Ensifer adhaerens]|uniref:hypothetical protein n=1 Tax=Ensifer adhaerens TaxID=106592 RepID=UPI0015693FF9|nr:hypothetical protein [Ensifer adhaerens]NRP21875.1 hypothetical protein [Ensifer adhaerens]